MENYTLEQAAGLHKDLTDLYTFYITTSIRFATEVVISLDRAACLTAVYQTAQNTGLGLTLDLTLMRNETTDTEAEGIVEKAVESMLKDINKANLLIKDIVEAYKHSKRNEGYYKAVCNFLSTANAIEEAIARNKKKTKYKKELEEISKTKKQAIEKLKSLERYNLKGISLEPKEEVVQALAGIYY